MKSYISQLKNIELEARFNLKLKKRDVVVPAWIQYMPHLDRVELMCKCESPKNKDKAAMCSVEIDFWREEDRSTIYDKEEKMLNELCDQYLDRMNELETAG